MTLWNDLISGLLWIVGISSLTTNLFAMESVPQAEYHQRRVALAEKLRGGAAVVFAAEEPVLDFMAYRQDSDFFLSDGVDGAGGGVGGDRRRGGDDGAAFGRGGGGTWVSGDPVFCRRATW